MLPASAAPASQGGGRMMGGDDDDNDTIVETQEISSENLFHTANGQGWQLALRPRSDQRSKRPHDGWVRGGGSGLNVV